MSRNVNEDPLNLQSVRTAARRQEKALSKSSKEPLPTLGINSPAIGITEPTSRHSLKFRRYEYNTRAREASRPAPQPTSQEEIDPKGSETDTPRGRNPSFTFLDLKDIAELSSLRGKLRAIDPPEPRD
ncbi:hypothetical protein PtrM4_142330 [Pyrenophora tritici-repentis]|uniref:Uncharacterized protein n=1 Tax=Pyrenophora tritici-repentis TaxID=45151 RepID=A0A834RQA1_9PLEO|nr:hypothetical protein PtrM4_142330 [Pyrenophora tritici-repentis]KAI1507982.1 hypothetical protein Ptr86124_013078 [Pyrenophora tritici-repentis]KAI1678143.1 hypothetical protein KJE20_11751 [Pyrenophora tritici-repentis]